MFYTISFSSGTVRRRRLQLLLKQGLAAGGALLLFAALVFSYRSANGTVYALCKQYAEVYRRLAPRDMVMSVTVPVVSEFFWTQAGMNQSFQTFLDSLTRDLKIVDSSKAGTIRFSSSTHVLVLTGDLVFSDFLTVDAWFSECESATNEAPVVSGLSHVVQNDPLVTSYLRPSKQTMLQRNVAAQKEFLQKNMKQFSKLLWRDHGVHAKGVEALSEYCSDYFLIDPHSTLRLMGSDTLPEVQKLKKKWKRLAGGRFSFRRKMYEDLAVRIDELRALDVELPQQNLTQPVFPQTLWLLNTSTNFLTVKLLTEDRAVFRLEEIAGWAGFYKPPVVTCGPVSKEGTLFSRRDFTIISPKNTKVSFRQFIDFYKCLANEPERFQVEQVSELVVELVDGAVFVNEFVLKGFVVGVDSRRLSECKKQVDCVDRCLSEWKRVHALFQTAEPKGRF